MQWGKRVKEKVGTWEIWKNHNPSIGYSQWGQLFSTWIKKLIWLRPVEYIFTMGFLHHWSTSLCMGGSKILAPFIKISHAPGSHGLFFFAPQLNSQRSLNSIVFCAYAHLLPMIYNLMLPASGSLKNPCGVSLIPSPRIPPALSPWCHWWCSNYCATQKIHPNQSTHPHVIVGIYKTRKKKLDSPVPQPWQGGFVSVAWSHWVWHL